MRKEVVESCVPQLQSITSRKSIHNNQQILLDRSVILISIHALESLIHAKMPVKSPLRNCSTVDMQCGDLNRKNP